jgi:hypothetical protein
MSNIETVTFQTKRPQLRLILWGGAIALYLIPVVAKLIGGDAMLWTASDFVFAAIGILVATAVVDLGIRKAPDFPYAVASAIAVGICFLTIWANGAVGIVGNEDNPVNAAFYGVVLFAAVLAVSTATLTHGRPDAMAKAMTACAIAQVSAGVIVAAMGYLTPVFTPLMAGLWLLSAALFRKAGRNRH